MEGRWECMVGGGRERGCWEGGGGGAVARWVVGGCMWVVGGTLIWGGRKDQGREGRRIEVDRRVEDAEAR